MSALKESQGPDSRLEGIQAGSQGFTIGSFMRIIAVIAVCMALVRGQLIEVLFVLIVLMPPLVWTTNWVRSLQSTGRVVSAPQKVILFALSLAAVTFIEVMTAFPVLVTFLITIKTVVNTPYVCVSFLLGLIAAYITCFWSYRLILSQYHKWRARYEAARPHVSRNDPEPLP